MLTQFVDVRLAATRAVCYATPPNAALCSCKPKAAASKVPHPFGTFCEHLVRVPIRSHHDEHSRDVIFRHLFVEKVTYLIHENSSGSTTAQRLRQLFWDEARINLVIRMSFDATIFFCQCSQRSNAHIRAHLCAAANRIPCCVRPFNGGSLSHSKLPLHFDERCHALFFQQGAPAPRKKNSKPLLLLSSSSEEAAAHA